MLRVAFIRSKSFVNSNGNSCSFLFLWDCAWIYDNNIIIIPFVILYVLRLIDTKFHIRDDIEKVLPNLDILGEVPFVDDVNAITVSYTHLTLPTSDLV